MRRRTHRIIMAGILALVLALGVSSTAFASNWTDLPDSLLAPYGITSGQVAEISAGFSNGLWRPAQDITRAQFVKMVDAAFDIALVNPAVPTYVDVSPRTNTFYQYIEGAAAAGLIKGVSLGHFSPNALITREQGLAVIARAVAIRTGQDLATTYTPEQINGWLATFPDGSLVSSSLRNEVVFATNIGLLSGVEGDTLAPRAWLARIDAAVFIIRAGAPSVASINPGSGSPDGGETVTLTGTGFLRASAVHFVSTDAATNTTTTTDATSFTVLSDILMTVVVPEGTAGTTVNVTVTNAAGTSTAWEVAYTYGYDMPTVTMVNPGQGSVNGGDIVTIFGTGFSDLPDPAAVPSAVQFGSTNATSFTVISDTKMTATTPKGDSAGESVYVSVTTPGGRSAPTASSQYTYTATSTH